jgi:GNAT superfamily N-acetyltransferase
MMQTPDTPQFTWRRAWAADATTLATLRLALFDDDGRGAAAGDEASFVERCTRAFVAAIESGACLAWLAEANDGEAIGAALLLVLPKLPAPRSPGTSEGHLSTVYTRPPWRRRGVATALVHAAIAEGRARGFARIRLHATTAGQPLYARAGFLPRVDEMELRL